MHETFKDSIVEKIREIRCQIEKENGDDLDRMAEAYYENQCRHPEKYVTRHPRHENQGTA
jgi:hypothetical protein